MKARKFLPVALSALFAVSAFSSCFGFLNNSSDPGNDSSSSSKTSEKPSATYTTLPDDDTANLTDEQKDALNESIKSKFTGPNANSFMLYFTNDEGKKIEVDKIESDETPERFVSIRNASRENIFVSLRISPLLCGLGLSNTGFATQEYSDSYKLYDRTVAEPVRHIIERSLAKITGIDDVVTISQFTINFSNE